MRPAPRSVNPRRITVRQAAFGDLERRAATAHADHFTFRELLGPGPRFHLGTFGGAFQLQFDLILGAGLQVDDTASVIGEVFFGF